MLIRPERPDDRHAINDVLTQAFRRPDSTGGQIPEVWLVEALRGTEEWIPSQALVALSDDELVGYCLCTRARVGDTPALALGPIGVAVAYRSQGIGTALMNTAIETAADTGEPLIGLLGDHEYYGRFGFVPASRMGIHAPSPSWGNHFQVKELPGYKPSITGRFQYAKPFDELS